MSLQFTAVAAPGTGLQVTSVDNRVTLSGITATIGDCLLLPTDTSGIASTAIAPTSASTGVPGANIVEDGWFGIVIDLLGGGGADGTDVIVRTKGVVKAWTSASAAIAIDQAFAPNTSKQMTASVVATAGEANKKLVAVTMESDAAGSPATILRVVLFDGINGFGRAGGAT